MGLYLIADSMFTAIREQAPNIAFGCLGLGFVIFVHELGHFLVAKACGVKCEKFYLGFDFWGLRLCRFQYGETEYGIGIFPFGGYVKMLGQDDNPARAAAERERSQIPATTAEQVVAQERAQGESSVPATEPGYVLDPRSYMAKSVPQRMAIISAGVIMNVIFAFIMATIAYRLGVIENPCQISALFPGETAWKADIQPGDKIVMINDAPTKPGVPLRYRDMMNAVMFGDLQEGIKFKIERNEGGVEKTFDVTVKPDAKIKDRMRPTIGALAAASTTLAKPAAELNTPAAAADFMPGDTIVEVNKRPIKAYTEVVEELTRHPGEPLTFVVERKAVQDEKGNDQPRERATVVVQPRHRRTLGLVMNVGKITAVQANSPAQKADIQAGDFIEKIDGEDWDSLDPVTLDDRLRGRAGEKISVRVSREGPSGKSESLDKEVTLRDPAWYEESMVPGGALSAPTLGIAYRVLNVVHRTEEGSPARNATLMKDGKPAAEPHLASKAIVAKAEIIPGSDAEKKRFEKLEPFEFGDDKPNWPYFLYFLQALSPEAKVKLTLTDGRTVELQPVDAPDSFIPDRGLGTEGLTMTTKAENWSEAMVLGARETKEGLLQVYSFLRRIGTQISAKGMAGPWTILKVASSSAEKGTSTLLIFLVMLSTNLAVINFLPIPVLDGGHMVFLAYEGIFRRPVNERIRDVCTFAGFAFILLLMAFVVGLDAGWISRGGA